MNNRIGEVFIRNIFAGILKETDDGYSFIYDEDYLKIVICTGMMKLI